MSIDTGDHVEVTSAAVTAVEQTRAALAAGEQADLVHHERDQELAAQHAVLAAGLPENAAGQP